MTELRPLERRVLALRAEGLDHEEIAEKFRRSPGFVARVEQWAQIDRPPAPPRGDPLRPVERRVLRWRDEGASYQELAEKFHRSPDFMRRVEDLARYKLTS